ncbi:hypothetical protein Hanom_Chr09g00774291 [Helianthus anomalus]
MLCFIKTLYFTDFIKKRIEFPLFLDAPDDTSCRYFSKFNQFTQQYSRIINFYKQDIINPSKF